MKIVTCYYLILVGILSFQAVQTVFQLSQTIGFGQKISHLQKQKAELLSKQNSITQNYYQLSSITTINEEDTNFIAISRPIIVSGLNTSVASR